MTELKCTDYLGATEALARRLIEAAAAAELEVPGVRVKIDGNRIALDVCYDADIDPDCEVEYATVYMTPREAVALALRLVAAAVTIENCAGGQ